MVKHILPKWKVICRLRCFWTLNLFSQFLKVHLTGRSLSYTPWSLSKCLQMMWSEKSFLLLVRKPQKSHSKVRLIWCFMKCCLRLAIDLKSSAQIWQLRCTSDSSFSLYSFLPFDFVFASVMSRWVATCVRKLVGKSAGKSQKLQLNRDFFSWTTWTWRLRFEALE